MRVFSESDLQNQCPNLLYQNDNFGDEGFLIFDTDPKMSPGQTLKFSDIPSLDSGFHPFMDDENKMSRSPGKLIVIDSIARGDDPIYGGLTGSLRWDLRAFGITENPSKVFMVFYSIQDYIFGDLQ
jgi:hypothetical protein